MNAAASAPSLSPMVSVRSNCAIRSSIGKETIGRPPTVSRAPPSLRAKGVRSWPLIRGAFCSTNMTWNSGERLGSRSGCRSSTSTGNG